MKSGTRRITFISLLNGILVSGCYFSTGARDTGQQAAGGRGSGGSGASGGGGASSICSSGQYWKDGNNSSPKMHPGDACIKCHSENRDPPLLTVAGTVYRTLHEPVDCNGVDGVQAAARVIITDAQNKEYTLEVNQVGNFYLEKIELAIPYTAKIVVGNKERVMLIPQIVGDCNSCHTERGAEGAPGRIPIP